METSMHEMGTNHNLSKVAQLANSSTISGDYHPHSIVWTTLPILSWIFPFIGHVGITDSKGHIYDFSGNYQVDNDNFVFGPGIISCPISAIYSISHDNMLKLDNSIREATTEWKTKKHHIISNNCHHFCIDSINRAEPTVKSGPINLVIRLFIHGSYLEPSGYNMLRRYAPCLLLYSLIILLPIIIIHF
jgi:hypothetical protein